jgi:hypothetical protein
MPRSAGTFSGVRLFYWPCSGTTNHYRISKVLGGRASASERVCFRNKQNLGAGQRTHPVRERTKPANWIRETNEASNARIAVNRSTLKIRVVNVVGSYSVI